MVNEHKQVVAGVVESATKSFKRRVRVRKRLLFWYKMLHPENREHGLQVSGVLGWIRLYLLFLLHELVGRTGGYGASFSIFALEYH